MIGVKEKVFKPIKKIKVKRPLKRVLSEKEKKFLNKTTEYGMIALPIGIVGWAGLAGNAYYNRKMQEKMLAAQAAEEMTYMKQEMLQEQLNNEQERVIQMGYSPNEWMQQ